METLQHRNASFISHQPIIKDHRNYVWQSLRKNPNGLTAQQITDLSNKRVSLISSRSRLNELLNDCLIRVKGSARNPKTGKVNSTYSTLEKSESLFFDFMNDHSIDLKKNLNLDGFSYHTFSFLEKSVSYYSYRKN